MSKDFRNAVASFVGTIIGAGIFGIPFVFMKAGFAVSAVLFFIIFCAMLLLHLMYGEVVERTREQHRLIGYGALYLGNRAKKVLTFSAIVGSFGGLVVYILLANEFFKTLFGTPPFHEFFWGFLLWAVMGIGVAKGMKTIARAEFFLSALLILSLGVILASSFNIFDANNLSSVNWGNAFLPYGVIFFSLAGFPAIPEIRSSLKLEGKRFRNVILLGFLLAGSLTFIFGLAILGATGPSTTPDAITGLIPHVGKTVLYIGAVFGVLAIVTSYLVIAVNLKDSFVYDWNKKPFFSNVVVISVPMFLVLAGVHDFIQVLGVTGAFLGAFDGIAIAAIFVKAQKNGSRDAGFTLRLPNWLLFGLISILALGMFYVIIEVINANVKAI